MIDNHIPQTLVKSFVKGNTSAFRHIFDMYHGRVLAYSLRIARSADEAEEIAQLVFIRLWEKRHHVDTDKSLDQYLYKITRNCAFNYLKQKATRTLYQQKACETYLATTENSVFDECERLTYELIETLPEKRQVIFKMHFEQGYSPTEIAQLLGVSLHTVKSQLVKATKTVKNFLLKYHTLARGILPFFLWLT